MIIKPLFRPRMFPLLAFLVPLAVRAVPEILMGPYIVGFDTVAYYIPNVLTWVRDGVDFWHFIGTAPLFYMMLMGLTFVGIPITLTLKIIPSLLHGFLALSIYFYANKALAWSHRKSLFVALLATLYFVALRVSWDMLRNELGLALLFVTLILLRKDGEGWRSYALLSMFMSFVVLAHQLVAVIMFVIVLVVVLGRLFSQDYGAVKRFVLCSLPASMLFILIVYADFVVLPAVSTGFAGSRSGWLSLFGFSSVFEGATDTLSFLFYCYLPLLPFVLIGFKRFRSLELKTWFFWCLISFSLPFFFSFAPLGYRWILLLVFPAAFFAVEGLEGLGFGFWKKVWVGFLVLLSFSFVFLPTEAAFPYFRLFPYYFPSSMLQNSVSLSDCEGVIGVLGWVESNVGDDGVFLAHDAFYGWAVLSLDGVRIVRYGYASPEEAAQVMLGDGFRRVFLVWWVSGLGWHGVASLPSCFVEVFHSGRIAVYEYGVV